VLAVSRKFIHKGRMNPLPHIIVAICTYKRNELLERLLEALIPCANRISDRAKVGVALVDDTPDGQAWPVAEKFADRFDLGVEYRISGKKNISLARNLALETALVKADWIAMTDDELGVEVLPDRSPMTSAATFNTLISSDWLKAHPDIRFDPHFGVIGGEDMVFFRAAHKAGLQIRFAEAGFTFENEPSGRATFAYQLYVYFWHGNSAALSLIQNGMSRPRAAVHAGASLLRAFVRPASRLSRGQAPQMRFMLAQVLHATGKTLGAVGLKVDHK
jgi:hypothetical protein